MKKPLLFCLVVWLVLLVLPWTRGQLLLDWRGATVEQLSGSNPAWAPLDPPYRPEKSAIYSYMPEQTSEQAEETRELVKVNGLSVAPQFAPVARGSSDRDVLLWCALWTLDAKELEGNVSVLEKRFPNDAALLAWSCGARTQKLSLMTRVPGPLSSGSANWSVQLPEKMPYPMKVADADRSKWVPIIAKARSGQKLEPENGFWWWLEATALLGARRDEEVWPVLKVGSSKTVFDDHSTDKLLALRRAHLKVLGEVPALFFLENNADSFLFYSRWREVTRQVCENVMGARLAGRHKTALEGGRDMMLMGRLLRRSPEYISTLVGISVEAIAMQSAALPSISNAKRLPTGSNAVALAGHPRSLLRYASELNRKDIALQITNEWNAVAQARKTQAAKTKALLASASSQMQGVNDVTMALAAGSQNMGRLLVQTLPIPLGMLALLSLLFLRVRWKEEATALPAWTRGLGWSGFALVVLVGAQTLFGYLAWRYMSDNSGWTPHWGFYFILPRLVFLLPTWAFGFAACVVAAGALWATIFAFRRARGDASLMARLRGMLSSTDERTGAINLGPILQLIGLVGIWGMIVIALGLWFFVPQNMALETQASDTLHDQYAGMALALFCLAGTLPALEFRVRGTKCRAYFVAFAETARRFLVAHLVLTTALYLLLAVSGAYWGTRLDAEWLQANAPQTASAKK